VVSRAHEIVLKLHVPVTSFYLDLVKLGNLI